MHDKRYRLYFFVNESFRRDNKKEKNEIKNVKQRERIKKSLRCCCVIKVIILEK